MDVQVISQSEASRLFGIRRQWFFRHRQELQALPTPKRGDKRKQLFYLDDVRALIERYNRVVNA